VSPSLWRAGCEHHRITHYERLLPLRPWAWVALLTFVRIATNPAIHPTPMTVDDAVDQIESWLGAPSNP